MHYSIITPTPSTCVPVHITGDRPVRKQSYTECDVWGARDNRNIPAASITSPQSVPPNDIWYVVGTSSFEQVPGTDIYLGGGGNNTRAPARMNDGYVGGAWRGSHLRPCTRARPPATFSTTRQYTSAIRSATRTAVVDARWLGRPLPAFFISIQLPPATYTSSLGLRRHPVPTRATEPLRTPAETAARYPPVPGPRAPAGCRETSQSACRADWNVHPLRCRILPAHPRPPRQTRRR
jgi:hypothetical protein